MPACSSWIPPAPFQVSLAACPPSSNWPIKPTVPSCSPAPCASPLPTPCTHLLPLLPCSRPAAVACSSRPIQLMSATTSYSPPAIPSAHNPPSSPMTSWLLKQASPSSTGSVSVNTPTWPVCAPVPCAPPIGKPSSASYRTAPPPRASQTSSKPAATTTKPGANCSCA